jgi:molybdate transport system ATP-binding protein
VRSIGVVCEAASVVLEGRAVVDSINLTLAPGEHCLLLGANGAGKTQLLKLLAAERWPTPRPDGRERRSYTDATGRPLEPSEVLPRIAFVGGERQDKYFRYDWNFTVQRVVATGVHGLSRPIARLTPIERARVRRLLVRMGLVPLARRQFLTLSYGERRRVLLARALAMQPGLLLLDEPHNGLDGEHRRWLDRELRRLARTRLTIVLSAHRADDAPHGFDRAVVLERGRVVFDGPRVAAPGVWIAPERPAAPAARRAIAARPREPLIELGQASIYRDYKPVVTDLNWRIGPDEHWAIVGANGSGKSTLLAAIYGLLPFDARSQVVRRGQSHDDPMVRWRRRLGFVSPELQGEYLDRVSLLDFVVSGLRLSFGLTAPATPAERSAARSALRLVGLDVDTATPAHVLSYGQRRLALFARAIVGHPEALLLDEPLTGLDAPMRAAILHRLASFASEGVQLVMAVHHPTDLPDAVRHRLELKQGMGRVASLGTNRHSRRVR